MNSTEFDVDVTIVGAGPTGLALACELRLAGVTCRVLERRADEPNITRAFAVHARALELLDARDMADQLVAQGIVVQEVQPAPGAHLDLRPLRTRYPMVLIIAQSGTERMLEQRADPVRRHRAERLGAVRAVRRRLVPGHHLGSGSGLGSRERGA